jgi:hypothetical protein
MEFFSTKDVEWNDLDVYIAGVKCGKVVDFECGVKQDKEYLYAAHNEPLSIQSGNKSYPFTVVVLKSAVDTIWDAAVVAGGDHVTDISFDIQGSFRAQGARALSTLNVVGCEVSEVMFKIAQNDKKIQVSMPGLAMGMVKV